MMMMSYTPDVYLRSIGVRGKRGWCDPLSPFCPSSSLSRANYVLSTVLNIVYVLSHLITLSIYYVLQFTEKTEAQQ